MHYRSYSNNSFTGTRSVNAPQNLRLINTPFSKEIKQTNKKKIHPVI